MPSRYKRVLDKATGKHYYYDKETKETVSELYVLRCKSRNMGRGHVEFCGTFPRRKHEVVRYPLLVFSPFQRDVPTSEHKARFKRRRLSSVWKQHRRCVLHRNRPGSCILLPPPP